MIVDQEDQALHRQIIRWHAENRLWIHEVAIWRGEHDESLPDLAKFSQSFLHDFKQQIDQHADELLAHDEQMQTHEHALANHIRGEDVVPHDWLMEAHRRLARRHSQLDSRHAKYKAKFRALVLADPGRETLERQP